MFLTIEMHDSFRGSNTSRETRRNVNNETSLSEEARTDLHVSTFLFTDLFDHSYVLSLFQRNSPFL